MMLDRTLRRLLLTTAILPITAAAAEVSTNSPPLPKWPSAIDRETGRRVYQLTGRSGNNMAFYYLFKNRGQVGDTPYLAYRNIDPSLGLKSGATFFSINLKTGEERELTPRGLVSGSAEAVGEWLYAMTKADPNTKVFTRIKRWHLADGREEKLIDLDLNFPHSGHITVNADGTQALFFRPGKGDVIDLLCGDLTHGTQRVIAANQRMSHIHFGPVDPRFYTYLNKDYMTRWKMMGVGWVDSKTAANALVEPDQEYFKKYDGQLIPSHPYWDSDGHLMADMVDTSKPYTEEWNVRFTFDEARPGKVEAFEKVRIQMGQFQCHLNPGPKPEWFVGDGESADWWHKPGFSRPFIHKIFFDYANEKMPQIPLASNLGTFWKSGELEPNSRYIPGADLVVWNAFRTLDGQVPDLKPGGEETKEPGILWGTANPVKQNVFAVRFTDPPGWDFAFDTGGWQATHGISDFKWVAADGGRPAITGQITAKDPILLSPGEINAACESFPDVAIRIKNGTGASSAKLSFTTADEPGFREKNCVTFPIAPQSDEFVTYLVPMSSHPSWRGSLKQLRITLPDGGDDGRFSIQFIRLIEAEAR
jgi:hypothetical protein